MIWDFSNCPLTHHETCFCIIIIICSPFRYVGGWIEEHLNQQTRTPHKNRFLRFILDVLLAALNFNWCIIRLGGIVELAKSVCEIPKAGVIISQKRGGNKNVSWGGVTGEWAGIFYFPLPNFWESFAVSYCIKVWNFCCSHTSLVLHTQAVYSEAPPSSSLSPRASRTNTAVAGSSEDNVLGCWEPAGHVGWQEGDCRCIVLSVLSIYSHYQYAVFHSALHEHLY